MNLQDANCQWNVRSTKRRSSRRCHLVPSNRTKTTTGWDFFMDPTNDASDEPDDNPPSKVSDEVRASETNKPGMKEAREAYYLQNVSRCGDVLVYSDNEGQDIVIRSSSVVIPKSDHLHVNISDKDRSSMIQQCNTARIPQNASNQVSKSESAGKMKTRSGTGMMLLNLSEEDATERSADTAKSHMILRRLSDVSSPSPTRRQKHIDIQTEKKNDSVINSSVDSSTDFLLKRKRKMPKRAVISESESDTTSSPRRRRVKATPICQEESAKPTSNTSNNHRKKKKSTCSSGEGITDSTQSDKSNFDNENEDYESDDSGVIQLNFSRHSWDKVTAQDIHGCDEFAPTKEISESMVKPALDISSVNPNENLNTKCDDSQRKYVRIAPKDQILTEKPPETLPERLTGHLSKNHTRSKSEKILRHQKQTRFDHSYSLGDKSHVDHPYSMSSSQSKIKHSPLKKNVSKKAVKTCRRSSLPIIHVGRDLRAGIPDDSNTSTETQQITHPILKTALERDPMYMSPENTGFAKQEVVQCQPQLGASPKQPAVLTSNTINITTPSQQVLGDGTKKVIFVVNPGQKFPTFCTFTPPNISSQKLGPNQGMRLIPCMQNPAANSILLRPVPNVTLHSYSLLGKHSGVLTSSGKGSDSNMSVPLLCKQGIKNQVSSDMKNTQSVTRDSDSCSNTTHTHSAQHQEAKNTEKSSLETDSGVIVPLIDSTSDEDNRLSYDATNDKPKKVCESFVKEAKKTIYISNNETTGSEGEGACGFQSLPQDHPNVIKKHATNVSTPLTKLFKRKRKKSSCDKTQINANVNEWLANNSEMTSTLVNNEADAIVDNTSEEHVEKSAGKIVNNSYPESVNTVGMSESIASVTQKIDCKQIADTNINDKNQSLVDSKSSLAPRVMQASHLELVDTTTSMNTSNSREKDKRNDTNYSNTEEIRTLDNFNPTEIHASTSCLMDLACDDRNDKGINESSKTLAFHEEQNYVQTTDSLYSTEINQVKSDSKSSDEASVQNLITNDEQQRGIHDSNISRQINHDPTESSGHDSERDILHDKNLNDSMSYTSNIFDIFEREKSDHNRSIDLDNISRSGTVDTPDDIENGMADIPKSYDFPFDSVGDNLDNSRSLSSDMPGECGIDIADNSHSGLDDIPDDLCAAKSDNNSNNSRSNTPNIPDDLEVDKSDDLDNCSRSITPEIPEDLEVDKSVGLDDISRSSTPDIPEDLEVDKSDGVPDYDDLLDSMYLDDNEMDYMMVAEDNNQCNMEASDDLNDDNFETSTNQSTKGSHSLDDDRQSIDRGSDLVKLNFEPSVEQDSHNNEISSEASSHHGHDTDCVSNEPQTQLTCRDLSSHQLSWIRSEENRFSQEDESILEFSDDKEIFSNLINSSMSILEISSEEAIMSDPDIDRLSPQLNKQEVHKKLVCDSMSAQVEERSIVNNCEKKNKADQSQSNKSEDLSFIQHDFTKDRKNYESRNKTLRTDTPTIEDMTAHSSLDSLPDIKQTNQMIMSVVTEGGDNAPHSTHYDQDHMQSCSAGGDGDHVTENLQSFSLSKHSSVVHSTKQHPDPESTIHKNESTSDDENDDDAWLTLRFDRHKRALSDNIQVEKTPGKHRRTKSYSPLKQVYRSPRTVIHRSVLPKSQPKYSTLKTKAFYSNSVRSSVNRQHRSVLIARPIRRRKIVTPANQSPLRRKIANARQTMIDRMKQSGQQQKARDTASKQGHRFLSRQAALLQSMSLPQSDAKTRPKLPEKTSSKCLFPNQTTIKEDVITPSSAASAKKDTKPVLNNPAQSANMEIQQSNIESKSMKEQQKIAGNVPSSSPVSSSVRVTSTFCLPGQSVPTTSPGQHYHIDNFLSCILKWQPAWLQEQDKLQMLPPVVEENTVWPLLETYDSFDDYYAIMKPLLLLETWQQVTNDWCHSQKDRASGECFDVAVCGVGNITQTTLDLECQGIICKQNADDNAILVESDFVSFLLKTKQGNRAQTHAVFGYVMTSRKSRARNIPVHSSLLAKYGGPLKKDVYVMNATIKLRYRSLHIQDTELMQIKVVCSLVSSVRRFRALLHLPKSPLVRDILRPVNMHVFMHTSTNTSSAHALTGQFNDSQKKAVEVITESVLQPYVLPRVCLLHGPPGTGKSHTIAGIVQHVIKCAKKTGQKAKILLCAPSNNAIDEITSRIIASNTAADKLMVVRVGKREAMKPEVRHCSLKDLALKSHKAKYDAAAASGVLRSISSELSIIQKRLHFLEMQSKDKGAEKKALNSKWSTELSFLNKKKQQLEKSLAQNSIVSEPLDGALYSRLQRDLLTRADVVSCTLTGAGSSLMLDTFLYSRDRLKHAFTCVIVDEATQCTELDVLIPLLYGCSKLVLVGDPHQLPATVLSKRATDMNYGQSLFQRLYAHFQYRDQNPVLTLSTQYRMHTEIVKFPNKFIYNKMLKTDRSIALKRNSFPFAPYLVFDVQYGRETICNTGLWTPISTKQTQLCTRSNLKIVRQQRTTGDYYASRRSVSNDSEAAFIIQLIDLLQNKVQSSAIGVITPYTQQRSHIQALLSDRGIAGVQCGTVDGFQGAEKDVIILSCVRAKANAGSIGFLADRNRMNVALTRAKYSLYVVGRMASLSVNDNWKAFITDAEKRHLMVSISTEDEITSKLTQFVHRKSKSC